MEKPNMYYNFDILINRVLESLNKTDLEYIRQVLGTIKGNTLVSGVGGSSVVSTYASKILSKKNGIITTNVEPRDINYMNISNYLNILSCSYSGNNYGVEVSFNNSLMHYLLSSNYREDCVNIIYDADKEDSFISLSSTLIPMSILLSYYLDNDISIIEEILTSKLTNYIKLSNIYEIFTGYETSSASKYLESTLTESGIAIAILHDKYDYCHGRSTIARDNNTIRILFNSDKELDNILINELNNIYVLDKKYKDDIINDYYLTYICMLLTKEIASRKNRDLSRVDYLPIVKKLYRFKGEM